MVMEVSTTSTIGICKKSQSEFKQDTTAAETWQEEWQSQ